MGLKCQNPAGSAQDEAAHGARSYGRAPACQAKKSVDHLLQKQGATNGLNMVNEINTCSRSPEYSFVCVFYCGRVGSFLTSTLTLWLANAVSVLLDLCGISRSRPLPRERVIPGLDFI